MPKYIDGIYNYCDRWCERCPFTSRCRTFAMEKAFERLSEKREKENARFWAAMQKTLGDSMNEISAMADELGKAVDKELEEFMANEQRKERSVRSHPLAKLSLKYSDRTLAWLKKYGALTGDLEDAGQVIRWYVHFIHVKLMRALYSILDHAEWDANDDNDEDEFLTEPGTRDCDGSAKIAIIAMERSISAWTQIREKHADDSAVTQRIVELARLRLMTDRVLPHARDFIRPGFDNPGV